MSLLTICQNAAGRIGIQRPTSVVSSTDQQALRLLGHAQQEGKALARRHTWQALTKEQTFTATATETQADALPSDFDRFVDETCFNRTRKREVYGPLNEQEWQFAKAVVSPVIIEAFRVRGSSFLMTPTPTAGDTIAFEYISKNWCEDTNGTDQSAWAADADTGILDEELITLGVVWRFKAGQGFDYAEEFNSYELMVAQAIARDGGRRVLNTARRGRPFRRAPYVQEGSWSIS